MTRANVQVVLNDTAKNPYSQESIIRRLLINGATDEYIMKLFNVSDNKIEELKEKNEECISQVTRLISKNERKFGNYGEYSQPENMMIDSFIIHQMALAEALGLTISQYREIYKY